MLVLLSTLPQLARSRWKALAVALQRRRVVQPKRAAVRPRRAVAARLLKQVRAVTARLPTVPCVRKPPVPMKQPARLRLPALPRAAHAASAKQAVVAAWIVSALAKAASASPAAVLQQKQRQV